MRTLVLALICLGAGFGFAKYQYHERHKSEENVMGLRDFPVSDASIKKILMDPIGIKSQTKSGKIEVVNGEQLNFGLMMSGTKRSHKFIFKNVGDASAKIKFLRSTCKCTVGKFEQAILKPGEQIDVELEWRAEIKAGEFSQSATIATDCPDQEEIQLSIKGEVVQGYVFDPPAHYAGEVFTNTEMVIPVTIYSLQDRPMELIGGRSQLADYEDKVRVEIGEERALQPGEIPEKADARFVVDAKITLLQGMPGGPLKLPIQFLRKEQEDSEPNREMPEFLVIGRCVNNIRFIAGDDYNEERNIYNLGSSTVSQGLKKKLMVAVRREGEDADPNLRVSIVSPSQLKATVAPPNVAANQRIYAITLEVPPGSDPVELDGTFSKDFGKIVIETDMESSPKIPIYVKLKVTK